MREKGVCMCEGGKDEGEGCVRICGGRDEREGYVHV